MDPLSYWLLRPRPDRAWQASLALGLLGALTMVHSGPWHRFEDGALLLGIALLMYCPFFYMMLRPAGDALSLYRVLRDPDFRLTLRPDDIDSAAATMARRMLRRVLVPCVLIAAVLTWGMPARLPLALGAFAVYTALLVYWALLASLTSATWAGILGFFCCYGIMLAACAPMFVSLGPGLVVVAGATLLARFAARYLAEPRFPTPPLTLRQRLPRRSWRPWLGAVASLYLLGWLLASRPLTGGLELAVISLLAGSVGWLAVQREVLAGTLDLLRMAPLSEASLVDGWAGRGLLPAALVAGAVGMHQPALLLGVPCAFAGAYLGVLMGLQQRPTWKVAAALAPLALLPAPALAGGATVAALWLRARCLGTLRQPA